MEYLIHDLRQAVEARLWYAALAVALAFPDIAAEVESPGERGYETRYARWWDTNLGALYTVAVGSPGNIVTFMTGRDAYALRCSFLHEGQSSVRQRDAIDQFQFMTPSEKGWGNHRVKVGSYLQLRVDLYCLELADAAEKWIAQRKVAGLAIAPADMLTIGSGGLYIGLQTLTAPTAPAASPAARAR